MGGQMPYARNVRRTAGRLVGVRERALPICVSCPCHCMWPSCEKLSRPFHHASPAREYRSSLRVRASRIQDIEMDRPTFMAEAPIPVVKVRMPPRELRSEEHTSELQSLMRISYAVFCL